MRQPTRLVRDGVGEYKLGVSLPGGRYQLSLDDRAVVLLMNRLELSVRDTVPEPLVPFLVAMGDAWFPSQRDTDAVIKDLQVEGSLGGDERSALIDYLEDSRIQERHRDRILSVLEASTVADAVNPDDLQFQELPKVPKFVKSSDGEATDAEDEATESLTDAEAASSGPESSVGDSVPDNKADDSIIESLQQISGIGPKRAERLVAAGVKSVEALADARPADLTAVGSISEDMAITAIEGAREVTGETRPAGERLARQTGVDKAVFESALAALAASGAPPSEVIPSLRVLYGPTVAEIDAVSGRQAYFLWEAGYMTPYDMVRASIDELTAVEYIGETTARDIQTAAKALIDIDEEPLL